MTKPIGIFGGAFDPIHIGHLCSALDVLRILDLEHIQFIPCKTPVHKYPTIANAHQRYTMVLLAIQSIPQFIANDCEITRESPSYMIETLVSLRVRYINKPLCLLLGTDAFMGLPAWKNWQQLLDYSHIILMQRPGYQLKLDTELAAFLNRHLVADFNKLRTHLAGSIYLQHITELPISSTQIRAQLQAGLLPHFLTPESVIHYIQQYQIYLRPATELC